MDNISLGRQGETMAASYLSAHGYTVLQRNYSCPMGELDIVARQGDVVAFVEVKTRRSLRYGRPCEAVNFVRSSILSNPPNGISTSTGYLACIIGLT